ncbi:MAG: NAD(+) synthase [Deferribacteres bacterium]|nr:NAD(+) synthase [candidate division KSB1 bacterium]MCB9503442.1 NAD(+) synthase [Deferribacteres bacterium]
MKPVKIGAASLNQTPMAWESNRKNIAEAIAQAKAEKVQVLCLPELCISGYGCEDMFHSAGLHEKALSELFEITPLCEGIIVAVGLPVALQNGVFNTSCLIVNGHIAGFAAKQFLAGDGIHYESRWFKPWPAGVRSEIEIRGKSYPIGDLFFDCSGIKIGFEICEDAWVGNRSGNRLAQMGVDIILNPSASHFAFGKHEIRMRYALEGSRAFNTSYVFCNLLGNEAGRAIYDGGRIIASGGHLLAVGSLFSFQDVQLTTAVIDVQLTRLNQMRIISFQPELKEIKQRVPIEFSFTFASEPVSRPLQFPLRAGADTTTITAPQRFHTKEEEFAYSTSLALFDYMRKSSSRGFVVSLSGGADSSAVASLIHLMIEGAAKELGFNGLREKLPYLRNSMKINSIAALKKELLLCVYQATCNSSEKTRNAARKLAEALGATFYELSIEDLVQGYTKIIEQSIERKLTWEQDDLALQNIQARVRAPGVWMLANIRGALLLSTSNRSEAAVGYATMDGDTSGGLSPIAGIDKKYLREWLLWMEKTGTPDLPAIPALKYVNEQQPTAELRPADNKQTDEDDLMPYAVLDVIERAAIRDKQRPVDAYKILCERFPDYSCDELLKWTQRFFRLWSRNQWKRERYAPSFHLDDENLDPKTWCRFPILSGGFEDELKELQDFADRKKQKK